MERRRNKLLEKENMMEIKTNILKRLLNKAYKNVLNKKELPITSLLKLTSFDYGYITAQTFDGSNTLFVGEVYGDPNKEVIEELNVVVNASSLVNLVNKLTQEVVKLSVKENSFIIEAGKGIYKFEMAYEQDELVKFPYESESDDFYNNISNNSVVVNLDELKKALTINEKSASKTFEMPILTGVYFGDNIITTDGFKACITNLVNGKLFKNSVVPNFSTLKLLQVFDEDSVNVYINEDIIIIYDNTNTIIGELTFNEEDYPKDKILGLLDKTQNINIKLVKNDLIDCLDRVDIFNDDAYTHIKLTTDKDKLIIESINGSGKDELMLGENVGTTSCVVDSKYLRQQLQSCLDNNITLKLGNGVSLNIEDSYATRIIGLVIDNE
ncbi:MAG: hypothetical protein GX625_18495 [Clostridiaceae bacterium]|nr:hypothetical protein [Clostridiaceae bacterium]